MAVRDVSCSDDFSRLALYLDCVVERILLLTCFQKPSWRFSF